MKQRLVENVLLTPQYYKRLQQSQSALKESVLVEGVNYKALAVYRFKFTRPGKKNLNGRLYDYDLWDKVIAYMRANNRSTLALMNHPPEDDPGDPKDIWAVARNLGYDSTKEFVEADFYIIDNEWGRTALGVLEAGGEIGLSSSGFGEFLSDGETVDPDSFELERVADWVMEPSYEVFGRLDDMKSPESSITEKDNTRDKDNKMDLSERKMKKLMEMNLQKICESISVIQDPVERRTKSKELLDMYEESELGNVKASLEKIVEECDADIQARMEKGGRFEELHEELEHKATVLSESQSEIERLKKENADLTAKLNEALDTLDSAKTFSKDTEKVLTEASAIKHNSVSYDEYLKLREYTQKVVTAYADLKKKQEKVKDCNKALAEKLRRMIQEKKERVENQRKAKSMTERQEVRIREKKVLQEKQARFEAEQAMLREAAPEVLQYFKEAVLLFPEMMQYKAEILKKRTLFEAQLFVLNKRDDDTIREVVSDDFDLSVPISERRVTQKRVLEPELRIPKGYM